MQMHYLEAIGNTNSKARRKLQMEEMQGLKLEIGWCVEKW